MLTSKGTSVELVMDRKIQKIDRKTSAQWYVGLPKKLAECLELSKGEWMAWRILDDNTLSLERVVPRPLEKISYPMRNK